jgi:hypothetical protein
VRSEGKVPKGGEPTAGFDLHDNAPAHRPVLVKDFLAKNNMTTLEHLHILPDLHPADFHPFRRLKSALKDCAFVMALI